MYSSGDGISVCYLFLHCLFYNFNFTLFCAFVAKTFITGENYEIVKSS